MKQLPIELIKDSFLKQSDYKWKQLYVENN